jgi:hypothetical protein
MKIFWLMLVPLFLFVSCEQEKDPSSGSLEKGNCMVVFSPALVATALTKTGSSPYLPKGSEVEISAYNAPLAGVESTTYAESTLFNVSDGEGTLTPVSDRMFLTQDVRYNFCVTSPVLPFKSGSKKIVEIPNGVDFKVSSTFAELTGSSASVSLPPMSHACSLVQFYLKRLSTNVLVRNISVGAGGLSMSKITHSPVSYTLGEGNIKIDGQPLDGTINVPGSSFYTQTAGSEFIGGEVVLPKSKASFQLNLNLVFNNSPINLVAAIPEIAFAPGRSYLYTVEISDDIVKIFIVLEWNQSGSGSDLGAPNAKIEVGSWNLTIENSTSAGGGNLVVVASPWKVNPSWQSTFGVGEDNTSGSVIGWNPFIGYTTTGGSNTNAGVNGWGNSSWSSTGGNSNGSGSVIDWNTDVTGDTATGTGNTQGIVSGWGVIAGAITSGGNNSSGSVDDWENENSSTEVGL